MLDCHMKGGRFVIRICQPADTKRLYYIVNEAARVCTGVFDASYICRDVQAREDY